MNKIFLAFSCLFMIFGFSQGDIKEKNLLIEAEMKAASKRLAFKANPNTANYDVTYQKLEFIVDPAVKFISGKVTTTFKALNNMSSITFDLSNSLTVSSVVMDATGLYFVQNTNDELVITLPTTITNGTSKIVEISYSGVPDSNGLGSFVQTTHNNEPVIWTLSEPFGAKDWWPCKQDLNDKIEGLDVYITAPSQYVSVSNGVEPEAQVINGNSKTTHFHHGYPIPSYLVAIAVTNYEVYSQTAGSGGNQFPVVNYLYPENSSVIKPSLAVTPAILEFFGNKFEIYPFHNEKYGHAQFGWGGGMEHTTVSFMGGFSRGLIAHEMAHQWFGDKITCGTWKDIWLNEGFATYLASMVIEHFDGESAFISDKASMINNITSTTGGAVYLTDVEALDENRIFSGRLSYNKGAMVLEMLRFKLGDAVFFQGIKNYLADPKIAYGYAITSDFQQHMENVYGSSLTEFFNDWVYNQGFPIYTINVLNLGSNQVKFIINQAQSDTSVSYFEMPVPIRIFGTNNEQLDIVLDNTYNGQEFTQNIPFSISSVELDPDKHLISKDSSIILGNSNRDWESKINIYPNPTNGDFQLQLPNNFPLQKIIIYNSLGQKIIEGNNSFFSIKDCSSGVYLLEIQTDNGIFHKKIIKK